MVINEKRSLPGFGEDILRLASNFGGGVAGWGDMCGAAAGAAMAFGLIYGTEGNEPLKIYDEMRLREKQITQRFLQKFLGKWGYITCRGLLGCEGCSPEQRFARYNKLKEQGLTHCDDFGEESARDHRGRR
jgi:C_GCAxxG_C_C family probable redox protein